MTIIVYLLIAFLPSPIKIFILRSMGHEIGRGCYIGASFLGVQRMKLEDSVYIGHGNIITGLQKLRMREGSRINRWNRITSDKSIGSKLYIGRRSAITLRHYFDVCNVVVLGSDSVIAGHKSSFFTHSKGVEKVDYSKPITIGRWCYLGSNLAVAPGTRIPDGVFVGMGAVIAGDRRSTPYVLMAGNPATVKKTLDRKAPYFSQGQLMQPHVTSKIATSNKG